METMIVNYSYGKTQLKGFAATEAPLEKRPVVLVAPAWRGLDSFAKEQAKYLATLGYVGYAIDMYGEGIVVSDQEAPHWMLPLFLDRPLLQKRVKAGFDSAKTLPYIDPDRVGAIGFCFGGLTVIELLRSGQKILGAVSFHAVLGDQLGGKKAHLAPISSKAQGSLLILNGAQDPLVSSQDLAALEKELTEAGIDWQTYSFSHTFHAFTNKEANDKASGLQFNAKTSKRAFLAMQNFFKEIF